MSDYKQTRDASGEITTQYGKMLRNLDDDPNILILNERIEELEAIAQEAARSGLHIGDLRVMPAAGVADILYEALDEIQRHRGIEG